VNRKLVDSDSEPPPGRVLDDGGPSRWALRLKFLVKAGGRGQSPCESPSAIGHDTGIGRLSGITSAPAPYRGGRRMRSLCPPSTTLLYHNGATRISSSRGRFRLSETIIRFRSSNLVTVHIASSGLPSGFPEKQTPGGIF
jgi:hypothetical protein